MPHHFTYYWKNTTFTDFKKFGGLIDAWESSNKFAWSQISRGDYVYSVTVIDGVLFLIAGLKAKTVVSRDNLRHEIGEGLDRLFEADHHVIAEEATPLNFKRVVHSERVRKLKFITREGLRNPVFDDEEKTRLNNQTFRNIRKLTVESAEIIRSFLLEPFTLVQKMHLEEWRRRALSPGLRQ